MSTLVGQRGQVTIDQRIRRALGIGPGWRVVQRVEGAEVVLRFVPPRHKRSLAGALGGLTPVRVETAAELEAAIAEAWHPDTRGADDAE